MWNNNVSLCGTLTDHPVLKSVNDKCVCNFTVALNRPSKDKPQSDFINCGVWSQPTEYLERFAEKTPRYPSTAACAPAPMKTVPASASTSPKSWSIPSMSSPKHQKNLPEQDSGLTDSGQPVFFFQTKSHMKQSAPYGRSIISDMCSQSFFRPKQQPLLFSQDLYGRNDRHSHWHL